jgi:hypothetical protein
MWSTSSARFPQGQKRCIRKTVLRRWDQEYAPQIASVQSEAPHRDFLPAGTRRWHQWQILTPRRARRTEVSCWISRQVAGPRVGWVTRCSRATLFPRSATVVNEGCFQRCPTHGIGLRSSGDSGGIESGIEAEIVADLLELEGFRQFVSPSSHLYVYSNNT